MECFKAYDCPGNVRELQNTVEAAMNMVADTDEDIDMVHLTSHFRNEADSITKTQIVESYPLPDVAEVPLTPKSFSTESASSLVETQSDREQEMIPQALRECKAMYPEYHRTSAFPASFCTTK